MTFDMVVEVGNPSLLAIVLSRPTGCQLPCGTAVHENAKDCVIKCLCWRYEKQQFETSPSDYV
jgi:hypothetical protein